MPDVADAVDPHQDKMEDLLEQLGLHPAQLKAQQHLRDVSAAMPAGVDHPVDLTQPAPPSSTAGATPPIKPAPIPGPVAGPPKPPLINVPQEQPASTGIPPITAGAPPTVDKDLAASAQQPFRMPGLYSPPNPIIKTADEATQREQAELDRLVKTGSGIHQIKNPFLKGLARVGDVAGSMLFPTAMADIPGTELHHKQLINTQEKLLGESQGVKQKEITSEEGQGRVEAQKNPPKEWVEFTGFTGPNGEPLEINKQTGEIRAGGTPGMKPKEEKLPEAEHPIGDEKLPELNQMMANRYAILNPGKPMPDEYNLKPGATQKDFDHADKLLEAEEKARGTKAQQDESNSIKQAMLALATEAREERKSKEAETTQKDDRRAVIGIDKNGTQILSSAGKAKELGLDNIMDAPAADVSKAIAARHFLPLVDNPSGKDVEHQGIKQIIDELDKRGRLGVVATRWNDFMTGKIGYDLDPDGLIERLRVKMGLAQTLLLNLHVGNRGGAYMLEHFEDLANSKKLDAATLRAGIDEEEQYARDRAMSPAGGGEGKTATKAQIQAVADKHKISYADAKKDAEANGVKVTE